MWNIYETTAAILISTSEEGSEEGLIEGNVH